MQSIRAGTCRLKAWRSKRFPRRRDSSDDPATGGFRWNNPIRQAQDGLTIMAEATGGFAVTDTDDFTSASHRIIEDLDHYYLLGFYPSDPGRTTGFLAGLAQSRRHRAATTGRST